MDININYEIGKKQFLKILDKSLRKFPLKEISSKFKS